jgi:cytochrome c-type biogenesis protein CcmH/NrfG
MSDVIESRQPAMWAGAELPREPQPLPSEPEPEREPRLQLVNHNQLLWHAVDDAVKVLRTVVTLDPRALGGQLFLGIDEYLTGDFSSSLSQLKMALQLDPTNREAGLYFGLTYLALNQPLRAAEALRATAKA